jgi:tight adherence protein B
MTAMIPTELWLIYALVFGAVLLGFQAIYWLLFKERREKQTINRRLALTAELANPREVLQILRKERGVDVLAHIPSLQSFKELVVQSGVRFTGTKVFLAVAIPAAVFFLVLRWATGSSFLAVTLACPLTAASIFLFLARARRRRIAAFSEQFPDALDVIARGLRAGHPFRVAIGLVAREMPDPVGSEFGIVADEITFGLEQALAVANLGPRVGHSDLSFFSTAVNIQHQTGGNLAEILSRLSRMLRGRLKLRLKIRALSSEGRLSAIVLSLTPFILFAVITLIAPDYYFGVKDHPIAQAALILGALLLVIGNGILYRMVNFKI